jgi:hypothetical protein
MGTENPEAGSPRYRKPRGQGTQGTGSPECKEHRVERAHTVNDDFIRFKYVVLAKYLHMSIFEFYLLIKQHSLILFKNLLWLLF